MSVSCTIIRTTKTDQLTKHTRITFYERAVSWPHKFNIGQVVDLMPKRFRAAALGSYEIRNLVPASDNNPDDPCYRIKSVAEKHERIAPESELTLSTSVFA